MKTPVLFAIGCIVCITAQVNAQSRLTAHDSIVTGPNGHGHAMVVQPDGKILVAGSSPFHSSSHLSVVRYKPNGRTDKDFGKNGRAVISLKGGSVAYSMALQADGKIIAAGRILHDFIVARFNTDGTLDSSFAASGVAIRDFDGVYDELDFVTIQPDNKILAIGTGTDAHSEGELTRVVLLRYNADGSKDSSFGTDGMVGIHVNDWAFDQGTCLVLKPDGKILAVGYSYDYIMNTAYDFTLVQFNPNGTVDSSYGTDGHIYTDISGFDMPTAIAVQSNGKIVIAGYNNFYVSNFILARYTKNGLPDSSFGTNGTVITAIGDSSYEGGRAYGIAIQPDDRIVLAGYAWNGSNQDFAVVRYKKNGGLDSSFGADGKVITDINGDDVAGGVSILPNGKILVAGYAADQFALAWYGKNGNQLVPPIAIVSEPIASSVTIKDKAPEINMYPNPARDILVINGLEASHKTRLSVIDLSGKIMRQIAVQAASYVLNIKTLSSGTYYLQLDGDNNSKSTRLQFIKE